MDFNRCAYDLRTFSCAGLELFHNEYYSVLYRHKWALMGAIVYFSIHKMKRTESGKGKNDHNFQNII